MSYPHARLTVTKGKKMRKTLCPEHKRETPQGTEMQCHGCGTWYNVNGKWVR